MKIEFPPLATLEQKLEHLVHRFEEHMTAFDDALAALTAQVGELASAAAAVMTKVQADAAALASASLGPDPAGVAAQTAKIKDVADALKAIVAPVPETPHHADPAPADPTPAPDPAAPAA